MKKLSLLTFLIISLMFSLKVVQAQAPQGITYQVVVRDGSSVISNANVNLLYAIEDANAAILYEESTNAMTNAFGQVTIVLGAGTPVIGTFDNIDWSQGGLQFEIEVTYNGTIYSLGRKKLESVPYAFFADRTGVADSAAKAGTTAFADSAAVAGSAATALTATNMSINDLLDVSAAPTANGQFLIWDGMGWSNTTNATLRTGSTGSGILTLFGSNGNSNITTNGFDANAGYLALGDSAGQRRVWGSIGSDGAGFFNTVGEDGTTTVGLGAASSDPSSGAVQIYGSGSSWASISGDFGGTGAFLTDGANGKRNFTASVNPFGANPDPDKGGAFVSDSIGFPQAGMYVDANNNGVIFGDIKNFRTPYPNKPGKEIWYASLEGPEAAAYVRGTAQLVNGEVIVDFPDHFEAIASPQSMTVILTPLSATSEGLAVIEKTAAGFKVKELRSGAGNYSFDWEVKCVRQGFENYQVVRDFDEEKFLAEQENMEQVFRSKNTPQEVQIDKEQLKSSRNQ